MKVLKEVCVESFTDALKAQERGADRIELCENLSMGGTTPSYGTIKRAVEKLNIPVFPMIRPRGGDFCYSLDELEIMREDIKICKSLGVKGVVFGMLTEDKKIDFDLVKEFVSLAYPMEVTFHKAIDELENPVEVIEELKNIGVKRILSSGTKVTALEGASVLNEMIKKAGKDLTIIVAGRVTKENFEEVFEKVASSEYHGKVIV